jgi:hypothetical protein
MFYNNKECKMRVRCFSLLAGMLFFFCNASAEVVLNYNFDEGSGSVVLDASPYGNNGTIYGNTAWTTAGVKNGALTLYGIDKNSDDINNFIGVPNATSAVTV